MTDVWLLVHAERAALIDDLVGLTDAQWAHPSLCEGWTVHDVAAHLVDNAAATRRRHPASAMVRARFDFDRQNAHGVARGAWCDARPRRSTGCGRWPSRTTTPGAPLDSRLVEEVVHGEDIRRPLGITRSYPREAVLRALGLPGAHVGRSRWREAARRRPAPRRHRRSGLASGDGRGGARPGGVPAPRGLRPHHRARRPRGAGSGDADRPPRQALRRPRHRSLSAVFGTATSASAASSAATEQTAQTVR